jgi:hypothetical protein
LATARNSEKSCPCPVKIGNGSDTYWNKSCSRLWNQASTCRLVASRRAADTFELVGIVGHDRGAGGRGVGGDQQVVAADQLSGRFQLRADSPVFDIGGNIERQHVDLP